jgi:hypothetical protein
VKLTPELEQLIVDRIRFEPNRAIVLPEWAYWKGHDQPVIYVDHLPVRLSRYLYEKLIGPLDFATNLSLPAHVHPKNVNPYLFVAQPGRKRGLSCPQGHAYEGNEMPDNAMGWRCRTCYVAWCERHSNGGQNAGQRNARKTHCPQGHPYSGENLMIQSNGRRRCRACNNEQSRAHYAATRAA